MDYNSRPISFNEIIALQFFALLRTGLWGLPIDVSLFERETDWQQLMQLAKEQTVTAFVLDGINSLPKKYCPEMKTLMRWVGRVNKIERGNELLNETIGEVVERYNKSGLEPILLKGQGIGQYYQNPSHRNSGDIDLYFSEGIEKANDVATTWDGVVFHEPTVHHQGLTWNGQIIENHRSYFDFYNPWNQNRWEKVKNMIPLTDGECLNLGKLSVMVPSPQMNALYIFLHLWHHFQQKGIGIRHVCDWLCLWKACEKKIDKYLFVKTVDMLPIKRPMTAVAWIGENYLGFNPDIIPLDTTTKQAKKDGELMLADILKMGNFGRSTDMMKGFQRGKHLNNLRSYALAFKRQLSFFQLCPSEIMAYPIKWALRQICE